MIADLKKHYLILLIINLDNAYLCKCDSVEDLDACNKTSVLEIFCKKLRYKQIQNLNRDKLVRDLVKYKIDDRV